MCDLCNESRWAVKFSLPEFACDNELTDVGNENATL